jgi:hypothetical protein
MNTSSMEFYREYGYGLMDMSIPGLALKDPLFVTNPYARLGWLDHKIYDEDSVVDILGNPRIIPDTKRVYTISRSEKGNENQIIFDLKNKLFKSMDKQGVVTKFPFSKTYIQTKEFGVYGHDPIEVQRFDLFRRKFTKGVDEDDENAKELLELTVHIDKVNFDHQALLNLLVEKTENANAKFEGLKLKPILNVECLNGTFQLSPYAILISSSLVDSIFNKSSWGSDSVIIDEDVRIVKKLFGIFLRRNLPLSESYLDDEFFEQDIFARYKSICAYIGFEFYENYFAEIMASMHYLILFFPEQAEVEEYEDIITSLQKQSSPDLRVLAPKSLRSSPDLRVLAPKSLRSSNSLVEIYKLLYSKTRDINFYTAMYNKGLSLSTLAASQTYNISPYLTEFLELY